MGARAEPELVVDGRAVARAEVAHGFGDRLMGLLGRASYDRAMVLTPARSVHTIGMRFPIDVAHVDHDGVVLTTRTMRPNRIGGLVRRSACVVEAAAGSFARWGVTPGCRIDVRDQSRTP